MRVGDVEGGTPRETDLDGLPLEDGHGLCFSMLFVKVYAINL